MVVVVAKLLRRSIYAVTVNYMIVTRIKIKMKVELKRNLENVFGKKTVTKTIKLLMNTVQLKSDNVI